MKLLVPYWVPWVHRLGSFECGVDYVVRGDRITTDVLHYVTHLRCIKTQVNNAEYSGPLATGPVEIQLLSDLKLMIIQIREDGPITPYMHEFEAMLMELVGMRVRQAMNANTPG